MARIDKDLDILKTKLINGSYSQEEIDRIMRAARFGQPSRENTSREMTITNIRKLVPQRGCSV